MAFKIGLIGPPNSGKSFARSFLKKGEEAFILAQNRKLMYLTTSDGKPVARLDISTDKSPNIEAVMQKLNRKTRGEVIKDLSAPNAPTVKIEGNWDLVSKLEYLVPYLNFIDRKMPHVKVVFIPDVTHFISEILARQEFILRKAGGDAYQRFWELAADALNTVILHMDSLRDDLVVVTEWHMQYNEAVGTFEIFVPGGKMLTDKFLVDSYYDVMLYSYVEITEDGPATADSYKFVTKRWGKYNARDGGLFEEHLIPNNIQLVLDRLAEKHSV